MPFKNWSKKAKKIIIETLVYLGVGFIVMVFSFLLYILLPRS